MAYARRRATRTTARRAPARRSYTARRAPARRAAPRRAPARSRRAGAAAGREIRIVIQTPQAAPAALPVAENVATPAKKARL